MRSPEATVDALSGTTVRTQNALICMAAGQPEVDSAAAPIGGSVRVTNALSCHELRSDGADQLTDDCRASIDGGTRQS